MSLPVTMRVTAAQLVPRRLLSKASDVGTMTWAVLALPEPKSGVRGSITAACCPSDKITAALLVGRLP